jgi:hypothetical protein
MIPFNRIKFCDLIVYVHLLRIAWIGLDVCTNVIHYHIFFQLGPYPLHKIQMEHNHWEIDLRWSLKPMVVQGSFMCLVAMGHLYNDRGRQWNSKDGRIVGTHTNTKYCTMYDIGQILNPKPHIGIGSEFKFNPMCEWHLEYHMRIWWMGCKMQRFQFHS